MGDSWKYTSLNDAPIAQVDAGSDQTVATGELITAKIKITSPGDEIMGFESTSSEGNSRDGSNWPSNESPAKAIDNLTSSKYLNFGQVGSGFYVTPNLTSTLTGLRVVTANDSPQRDPLMISLEGANGGDLSQGSSWTLIQDNINLGLDTDPGRFTAGPMIDIQNFETYNSYRVIIQSVRDVGANSMQLSEIELFGLTESIAEVALKGSVVDPDGRVLKTSWSKVSGPGSVVFAEPTNSVTTVTFSELGDYILRLSADDGTGQAYNDLKITVTDNPSNINNEPIAQDINNIEVHQGESVSIDLRATDEDW